MTVTRCTHRAFKERSWRGASDSSYRSSQPGESRDRWPRTPGYSSALTLTPTPRARLRLEAAAPEDAAPSHCFWTEPFPRLIIFESLRYFALPQPWGSL